VQHRPWPGFVLLTAAILALPLAACSGSAGPGVTDAGSPKPAVTQSSTADPTVTGRLDDRRHIARKTIRATRPHLVNHCVERTRQVRHTSSTRSGGRTKTRTWYTVEHYQDCEKVKKGVETYTRVLAPARWCLELDDVGGDQARDEVWYEVDAAVYSTVTGAEAGGTVSFVALRKGC
jgi:hypothetical protein